MKNVLIAFLAITVGLLMAGCTEDYIQDIGTSLQGQSCTRSADLSENNIRLVFPDAETFKTTISEINYDGGDVFTNKMVSRYFKSVEDSKGFISLVSPIKSQLESKLDKTYYETLGYDTLVPNIKMACLLNSQGEVEVGGDIVKITPEGTYVFPKIWEVEFEKYYENEDRNLGLQLDSIRSKISEHITLYRTFQEDSLAYTSISAGDITEFPNSYFGDIDDKEKDLLSIQSNNVQEPDFQSFAQFSANRKSIVGKFIQSIIGASKAHTIKFSKKRRVRGSFYFYNYGVYSEIGVKGWTDKKNWIGWSKTACDELRVGWKNVILQTKYPDNAKKMLENIRSTVYAPPVSQNINGRNYNTATLVMPEYEAGLKEKIIARGIKAIFDYIREIGYNASDLEKTEAFLVSTRTEVLFVCPSSDIRKYNEKYYCHVFNKQWMDFNIGWSNTQGFFIGRVNQNNISEIGPWIGTAIDVFNQKKVKLLSGEVYICARFGDVWKGMKITK